MYFVKSVCIPESRECKVVAKTGRTNGIQFVDNVAALVAVGVRVENKCGPS